MQKKTQIHTDIISSFLSKDSKQAEHYYPPFTESVMDAQREVTD